MYLKIKCLLIHLVSQNVIISNQIYLNNRIIGHDLLHRNGRRYYNFDYDFDKDNGSQTQLIGYKYNKNENHELFRKHDRKYWDPSNNTNSSGPTQTTPMIFVTIPTSNTPDITTDTATSNAKSSTIPDVKTSTVTAVETKVPGVETVNVSEKFPDITFLAGSVIPIPTVPNTETLADHAIKTSTVPDRNTMIFTIPNVESTTKTDFSQTISAAGETENTILSTTAVTKRKEDLNNTSTLTPMILSTASVTTSVATTQAVSTYQPSKIVEQALEDMRVIAAGYFTIFLLELNRIIAKKDTKDITRLLQALEVEVIGLLTTKKLSAFGKSTTLAFGQFVQILNNSPPEVIKYDASLAVQIISNRRETLSREIVNLLDQADEMFLEREGRRILYVLEDLDNYPNNNITAKIIVHEMMDAVFLAPMSRAYGTPKEIEIVKQIEELVVTMVFSGYRIQRRKGTDVPSDKKRSSKSKRYKTHFPSIRNKIYKYGNRRKPKTKKEVRRNFITTKTTLDKPRTANQIQKSIYTIQKNKKTKRYKKNLYKELKKEPNYELIYLKLPNSGRAKVAMTDDVKIDTKTTLKDSARSIKYVQEAAKIHRYKDKELLDNHKTNKDGIPKRYKLIQNKNTENNKIQQFEVNVIREESSFTDEEEKLKANLDDAFFHGDKKSVLRNRERDTVEREFEREQRSSYSDEEVVLKSKIYNVFGYGNNYAARLKKRTEDLINY